LRHGSAEWLNVAIFTQLLFLTCFLWLCDLFGRTICTFLAQIVIRLGYGPKTPNPNDLSTPTREAEADESSRAIDRCDERIDASIRAMRPTGRRKLLGGLWRPLGNSRLKIVARTQPSTTMIDVAFWQHEMANRQQAIDEALAGIGTV
jgi:hypothetical protein